MKKRNFLAFLMIFGMILFALTACEKDTEDDSFTPTPEPTPPTPVDTIKNIPFVTNLDNLFIFYIHAVELDTMTVYQSVNFTGDTLFIALYVQEFEKGYLSSIKVEKAPSDYFYSKQLIANTVDFNTITGNIPKAVRAHMTNITGRITFIMMSQRFYGDYIQYLPPWLLP